MPTVLLRRGLLAGLPSGAVGEPLFTLDQFRLYIGSAGGNRLLGLLHKIDGITAPIAVDDADDGYSIGSQWVDIVAGIVYVCVDSTPGAAVWKTTTASAVTSVNGQTGTVVIDAPGYDAENKDSVTLAAGGAASVHSSGTGVRRADAATTGYECVGLVAASTAPTFSADVRTTGRLTLANWTNATGGTLLTPNSPYFLSATTPGRITATPPAVAGNRVQQVGVAVSPNTLAIQILSPVLL